MKPLTKNFVSMVTDPRWSYRDFLLMSNISMVENSIFLRSGEWSFKNSLLLDGGRIFCMLMRKIISLKEQKIYFFK